MDEVQLEFGKVVKEVLADWGGNMTGFMVVCMRHSKTEPSGVQKFWVGGPLIARMDMAIEACKLTLDTVMSDNQCSPLEAMRILEGKILERKFLRDRQTREQHGRK